MVILRDPLSYKLQLAYTNENNSGLVNIKHYIDCDDDGIIIASNPELRHYIDDISAGFPESAPLRLNLEQGHNLSELLPYACAEVSHDDYGFMVDPIDFISDYQGILEGRWATWALCAVEVLPCQVRLYFIRSKDNSIGAIYLKDCPRQLWLEVPGTLNAVTDKPRLTDLLFRRAQPSNLLPVKKSTVVIVSSPEEETTTVWTGDFRLSGPQSYPAPGQRMLRLSYDSDGDLEIKRTYPRCDFSNNELMKLLSYTGNGYFAL